MVHSLVRESEAQNTPSLEAHDIVPFLCGSANIGELSCELNKTNVEDRIVSASSSERMCSS